MLVLTRRVNEKLVIGLDKLATISIISVQGNQVKIGIEAAKNIPVHREEVFDLISEAKNGTTDKDS